MESTGSEVEPQKKECEDENEEEHDGRPSWDDCPIEILIMILEMIPFPAVIICLFVNTKWNQACQHILNVNKLWHSLISEQFPHRGEQLKMKSSGMRWHQIYRNSILSYHMEKASYNLINKPIIGDNIRKLHVYRDNIIIIDSAVVSYYGTKDFKLRKEIHVKCIDFIENDEMIVMVIKNGNYMLVRMFGKDHKDDFNIDNSNSKDTDAVIFYKVNNNICYVINALAYFWCFSNHNSYWNAIFLARYYGNPAGICGINVYHDLAYLWLNTGAVLFADPARRGFTVLMQIKVPTRPADQFHDDHMFHMFGFVFKVPEENKFLYERYAFYKHAVYTFECPHLTSMLEHGDIIFLGNSDGTIALYRPRDLATRDAVNTIKLKDCVKDLDQPAIVALEAFEDVDTHHLYAATISRVFHFKIVHQDPDSYMWSLFPASAQMHLSYNTRGERHYF